MGVDALYESRFGRYVSPSAVLAGWEGPRPEPVAQRAAFQPTGVAGWIVRLSWLLGGSFTTCCLALSWVEYRPSADGMEVHLVFDPDLLPEHLVVSPGDDVSSTWRRQSPLPGATYVFDQACPDPGVLRRIHSMAAFFVSPLARDAVFRVVEVMPITRWSRRHGGFSDWLIELGGHSRRSRGGLTCRLTTHWAGDRAVHLITNRFDLRSPVVFGVYRYRWEIALFLEQIRHSPVQRFLLGHGRNRSRLRLFAGLLTLRAWQRVTRRVGQGQQEMAAAIGDLQEIVLGVVPQGEFARHHLAWQATGSAGATAGRDRDLSCQRAAVTEECRDERRLVFG